MPRAIIYVRVSTCSQQKLGSSLQDQQKMCELEARRRGITKKLVFQEALAGDTTIWKRPVLTDALLTLKRGDFFIVTERDRLGRSGKEIGDIEDVIRNSKATLIVVIDPRLPKETNDLQNAVTNFVAERELSVTRTKTKLALQDRKNENLCIGTVPFGMQRLAGSNKLEINDAEQEVIAYAKKYSNCGMPMTQVVKEINERYASRNNTPFSQTQVKRMLTNQPPAVRKKSATTLDQYVINLRAQGYTIPQITKEVERAGYRTRKGTVLMPTQINRILDKANLIGPKTYFVPFGFQISPTGVLQPCAQEQEIISLVHQLKKRNYNKSEILDHINHHGHRSRAGTLFQKTQIVRILSKKTHELQ